MPDEKPRKFLNDLEVGDEFEIDLLAAGLQKRNTKDGSPYLTLQLRDKTASMKAVFWNYADAMHGGIRKGDIVRVKGTLGEYNNLPQVKISAMEKVPDEKVHIEDFLAVTPYDREKLWEKIRFLLNEIQNPHLRALVQSFLDDKDFIDRFTRAPAAVMMHQPYIGGLLEHTHNLVRLAKAASLIYPFIDREILVVGAFFHDVGKIIEYAYDRQIEFTTLGKLKGHLVMGADMVRRASQKIQNFPEELILKLEHMILSHHGQKEWGSPVEPMFTEACMLHYLDNLDAKTHMFHAAVRSGDPQEQWSEFSKQLGHEVYLGESGNQE